MNQIYSPNYGISYYFKNMYYKYVVRMTWRGGIQVWFYYVSKDYLEERNGAALGFAVAAAESYGPSGLLHQKGC